MNAMSKVYYTKIPNSTNKFKKRMSSEGLMPELEQKKKIM